MNKKLFVLIIIMIFGFVFGMAQSAMATHGLVLTATSDEDGTTTPDFFSPGDEVFIHISYTKASGDAVPAAAAFMLEYCADIIESPITDSEGNSSDIKSPFPFTFMYNSVLTDTYRANAPDPGAATTGLVYYSGGTVNQSDGGPITPTSTTLFTSRFKVPTDLDVSTPLACTLTLKQTELWNPDAGWGTDANDSDGDAYNQSAGDTIGYVPVLVGATPNTDAGFDNFDCTNPPCAFPTLSDTELTGVLDTLSIDVKEASAQDFTISGTVTADTSQNGTLIVFAYKQGVPGTAVAQESYTGFDPMVSTTQAYTLTVPAGEGPYYIAAFVDIDGSGFPPNTWEAQFYYEDQTYTSESSDVNFGISSMNLDVDGTGEAKGLTDGLMILRKLATMNNEAVTIGARPSNAPRTTEEINDYIQAAKDNLILDVDGIDGAKGLTDGLMILRRLATMGSNYVTDGARPSNAPRTTEEIILYIDMNKPLPSP